MKDPFRDLLFDFKKTGSEEKDVSLRHAVQYDLYVALDMVDQTDNA